MKLIKTILLSGAALMALAPQAMADDGVAGKDIFAKERFMVRARAIGVVPQENSTVNVGGDVAVSNSITPEIDLTYFFTDHVAAELIAATAHHVLDYNGNVPLGETWILPPTLTVQYHFTPDQQFSPYVGAGLNYSLFYNTKSRAPFTDVKIDNGVGYALQAGTDYWLDDHWGLNFDVKKLFLNVDAKANGGAVRADVDLDPWIVGAGVSYKF